MDLSNRDNGGLDVPIEALQPVVDRHAVPGIVSRADIWALSAFVACDKLQSRIDYDMEWFGRLDCEEKHSVCLDADGNDTPCTATRGPHHDHPTIHVNTRDLYKFFEDEFGFNIRETVVVMGAHTLGALAEEVRTLKRFHCSFYFRISHPILPTRILESMARTAGL